MTGQPPLTKFPVDLPLQEVWSAHALEVALNTMPVGISWARTSDQVILFVNRTFTRMFGWAKEDFSTINHFIETSYPLQSDRTLAFQKWGEYFERPDRAETPVDPIEVTFLCKSGDLRTVVVSGIILPETGWSLATFVDITEPKQNALRLALAQERAAEKEAMFRLLLDHSPEMIVLSAYDSRQQYVSPAVENLTGFSSEEYLSLQEGEQIHADDRQEFDRAVQTVRDGATQAILRLRLLTKGGLPRWVEATLKSYTEPSTLRAVGYVATIRDISKEVEQEHASAAENRRLKEIANRDELTHLANRRAFNIGFSQETKRRGRVNQDLSILLFDIDRFKEFNDTYGHLAGDECLKQVARVLETTLKRDLDLIARFGGEEFIALLPSTSVDGAACVAERARLAVEALQITHVKGVRGLVTISVGVACWFADEPEGHSSLLDNADSALYEAKKSGRNCSRIWRGAANERD